MAEIDEAGFGVLRFCFPDAGWSSPVARWAHNPKVAGSNPAPATITTCRERSSDSDGLFLCTVAPSIAAKLPRDEPDAFVGDPALILTGAVSLRQPLPAFIAADTHQRTT